MHSRQELEDYWYNSRNFHPDISPYPTEPAMTYVSAYLYTGKEERRQVFKDVAVNQLRYARSTDTSHPLFYEDSNHILLTKFTDGFF